MPSKTKPAWKLDVVASAVAAASTDASQWVAALDVLASQSGSVGAVLLPTKVDGTIPQIPFSESIGPLLERYFKEGWVEGDLRRRGVPHLKRWKVFSERHYTTDEEIARHPYFQELLGSFGLRWSAVVEVAAADELWCIALQRSLEQGPFSTEELVRLRELSPSLSIAGTIARAMGFARAEAALEAFDASGSAVIMLDRSAQVFRMNAAVERLLGPDVQISQKRLRFRDREATRALDKALHELLWNPSEECPLERPVFIRRQGNVPLFAYPSRLSRTSVDALSPCQAIVALWDPAQRRVPSRETLRACFDLTDAEARLVRELALGCSLAEAAQRYAISRATARNQLAAVMTKLGVHRQAEVVALALALVPTVPC